MSKCRFIQTALNTVQSVESKGKAHREGETEDGGGGRELLKYGGDKAGREVRAPSGSTTHALLIS